MEGVTGCIRVAGYIEKQKDKWLEYEAAHTARSLKTSAG